MSLQFLLDLLTGEFVLVDLPTVAAGGTFDFIDATDLQFVDNSYMDYIS